MRLDGQFGSPQALDPVLRLMGAIDNVRHKRRSERQGQVVAVKITGAMGDWACGDPALRGSLEN